MKEFADRAPVLPTIRESEKFKQATRQGQLLRVVLQEIKTRIQ